MKIAWFTPYNAGSAIATYSKVVLGFLRQRFEMVLFLPGRANTNINSNDDKSIIYYTEDTLLENLRHFDFAIFNMGDSAYHIETWKALKSTYANLIPSVVIMHDWFNMGFFWSYYTANDEHSKLYGLVENTYGPEAKQELAQLVETRDYTQRLKFPLFEPILETADALIVHSQFCAKKVAAKSLNEIYELFIPTAFATIGNAGAALVSKKELGLPENVPIILTLGNCNSNKCVDKTIAALGKLKKSIPKFVFCIVGAIEDDFKQVLAALIEKYSLMENIRFHGYASLSEKHSYLVHADICVNLRNPCLEGASASLVEALAYGKASIVSNDGCYAEIPHDVLEHVEPGFEVEGLIKILSILLLDQTRRQELGHRAKAYADQNLNVARYVELFTDFVNKFEKKLIELRQVRQTAAHFRDELNNIKCNSNPYLSQQPILELLSFLSKENS